jgi:PAS domain S-box-containing protein
MSAKRFSLLIVDDEESHVAAITRAFEEAGADVQIRTAATLAEFRDCRRDSPPDMALIDLNLPDGRAVDVLTHPPEDAPFPILVMTAFGNQQIVVDVMKAGALDYLVKSPEAFAEMPRTVERARREWTLLQRRKQAEASLFRERAFMRQVIDATPGFVFVKDWDGRFLLGNKGIARHYGTGTSAIEGRTVADFNSNPQEVERFIRDDREVMRSRELKLIAEEPVTSADGRKGWYTTIKVPLLEPDGTCTKILGVSTEITDRRQAEQRLKETADELARSNKDLEEFAYVASHDLQEPVRMVQSFMQLLAERYGGQLDETAREYIAFAVDGADRLHQLILALLDYSRVGSRAALLPLDLNASLDLALNNLGPLIRETGTEIQREPLPTVRGDETQLTQLLQNLICNAMKYHRPGVTPAINIGVRRQDAERVIWVRDNGIGIPEEHFERIFQMFQRLHTSQEYPGTGIGLAICKKIVERHGGRIWVESDPGRGSTFFFTLPGA